MKIYYYKQQRNTFTLFNKKSPRLWRYYVIGGLLLIVTLFLFNSKTHSSHKEVFATANKPVPAQLATSQALSLEEETRATTLYIQNNIQQDSQKLGEGAVKQAANIHPKPLQLKVDPIRTVTVKPQDTLEKILKKTTGSKKELNDILNAGTQTQALKKLKPGQKLLITLNKDHLIQQLSYTIDPVNTLLITRVKDKKFKLQLKTLPLTATQSFAKFTVYGSFVTAAKKAGVNSKRASQLATIFKSNIDVNKGTHVGDKVCVLFQDYFLKGKKIREGEIVAAEYKTATNTYQAVRFTDPKGNSAYYAPDGTSMQKRFLPAPLKFTRISSLFNPKRWHPALHRFRHHQGVDYAAPQGTPIKSVANGTIDFLGGKGGYGNTIIIKHDSSYSTLYGHLSKYATNLKIGNHVQQGQLIGYVGSTGLATGPHLHFEFRINGVHRNPLTVALPNGKSITHAYRNKFHSEAKKLLAKIDAHKHSSDG